MRTWKLPRKRKKAYIARYGRERYRMARAASRCRNPHFSIDFGGPRPVVLLADVHHHQVMIIGHSRAIGKSALLNFMSTMPRRNYSLVTDASL